MGFWSRLSGSGPKPIDPGNVLITGVPRSGTTLACYLLNQLPDTVALHEPMKIAPLVRSKSGPAMCDTISAYFRKMRRMIRNKGMAESKHSDGTIPDNPVTTKRDASGERTLLVSVGRVVIDKPFSDAGLLAIKHPAAFTAIVDALVPRFRTYAIIRNPLTVLGSWNSVPFPHRTGSSPVAERLNPKLREALERIDDATQRQIYLLSWFYQQYHDYMPPECVLRYEDTIASQGKSLAVIDPKAEDLQVSLDDRNKRNVYDTATMKELGKRLLDSNGGYWNFYSKDCVAQVIDAP